MRTRERNFVAVSKGSGGEVRELLRRKLELNPAVNFAIGEWPDLMQSPPGAIMTSPVRTPVPSTFRAPAGEAMGDSHSMNAVAASATRERGTL